MLPAKSIGKKLPKVDDWIVKIEEHTPLMKKMRTLVKYGDVDEAARYAPDER